MTEELLRDFDVNPAVNKLQTRMATHFQHKLAVYHERIQRWVGELILQAKEQVAKFLSHIDTPVDPDVLRRNCDNVSKVTAKQLSDRLNVFSMKGPSVKLGKSAPLSEPRSAAAEDVAGVFRVSHLSNGLPSGIIR